MGVTVSANGGGGNTPCYTGQDAPGRVPIGRTTPESGESLGRAQERSESLERGLTRASERPEASERAEGHRGTLSNIYNCAQVGSAPPAPAKVGSEVRRAAWSKAWSEGVVKELYGQGEVETARKLNSCSSYLLFRQFLESDACRLRKANFCRLNKLCPWCARGRMLRNLREIVPEVERLLRESDVVPFMVTPTVPTGPDLDLQWRRMCAGLTALGQRRRDAKQGKRVTSEFEKFTAALWSFEVKRSKGLWHVHVHGLCLRRRNAKIDLPKLIGEWQAAAPGATNIDCRLMRSGRAMLRSGKRFDELSKLERGQVVGDVLECAKYQLKFDRELTPADAIEVHRVTHRRRFVRKWDGFTGLGELEAAGDLRLDEGPFRDWLYHWFPDGGYRLSRSAAGSSSSGACSGGIDPDTCPV